MTATTALTAQNTLGVVDIHYTPPDFVRKLIDACIFLKCRSLYAYNRSRHLRYDIIKKSKVFNNLEPALKNIDYLIATTSRFRNKNVKHIQLDSLKKIDFKKKIAFLFGSEASGLSNNEISYANYTMQIPTNPNFKSLNLSHSLIVISQLVFNLININKTRYFKSKKIRSATKNQIQAMTNLCIKNLEERNFFKPLEKKPIMLENLRSIFYKMELSEKETRILSSVFASLAKKGGLT